jgi:glycolate oxidase iron-sulfur subunit
MVKPLTPLGLDVDLLNACVSCGLCLPHCPTYRSTEEESASPRGRITAMRAVESGALAIDDEFVNFMERCVLCRGCETACPSGVHFGELMEGTRTALAAQGKIAPPALMTAGLGALRFHRLVLVGSSLLAVAQRLRLLPKKLAASVGLPPRLAIRRGKLRSDPGPVDAVLFTGCVMDAWQREVHQATLRVMRATGSTVGISGSGAACCGALHSHAGKHDEAKSYARRVIAALGGATGPAVVVNSAGCGAALKHYGELLDTEEARAFSVRVSDCGEWVADRVDQLPAAQAGERGVVAISDPCHLRHVQRAHLPTRRALAPFVDLVELDDEGRCCGAGGSYQVTQADLAEEIRAQKVASIKRSGANTVVSGNPGCTMWLEAAGVNAVHPMQVLDESLHGRPNDRKN